MANLILVTGLPASGKSRFVKFMSKKLSIPYFEKDGYKEAMFDDLGFESREEKLKLGVCSMDCMYISARQLLKVDKDVILDNNFESSSLPGLKKLFDEFSPNVITVRYEGDIAEIYKRFIKRDLSPDRHRGHIVNTRYPETEREEYVPISLEEFEKKFTERGMISFDPGYGELIRVDTTNFDNYSKEDLLQKVIQLMK